MGIFKSILGAMGFQEENEQPSSSKPAIVEEEKKEESPVQDKKYSVSNLVCYAPKSNTEVKLLVDCLKRNEPCIINLGGLSNQDIKSVLDFLGGAVYALGGSISRLQGELYVLSPKDVQIVAV